MRHLKCFLFLALYFLLLAFLYADEVRDTSNTEFSTNGSSDSAESYIHISGYKTLSIRGKYLLSGTPPPEFYPIHLRSDAMRLKINGKLKGLFDIEGAVSERGLPGEGDGLYFLLSGPLFEGYWGDYSASLSPLILRDKALTGVRGKAKFDRIEAEGMYSTSRGEPKRECVHGNNTQGPYRLGNVPIVYNSERVKVGRGLALELLEKGADYEIDYQTGEITFIDRIIKVEEWIEIDYEYSPTGECSSLLGLHTKTHVTDNLSFGATYVGNSRPQGKSINKQEFYGIDGELKLGKNSIVSSEVAHKSGGNAYRAESHLGIGNGTFSPFLKRTEPGFSPIGKGLLTNTTHWGINGDYKITEGIGVRCGYENLKEDKRHQIGRNAGTSIAIRKLPMLEYGYTASYENSDSRETHKTTITKGFKYISVNTHCGYEKGVDNQVAYGSEIYSAGFSTKSLNVLTLSGSADHEPNSNTYNLASSLTPSSRFSLSSSFTFLAPSSITDKNATKTMRLWYCTKPFDFLKSDGRYTIEALHKADQPAETHTGAFKLELNPLKQLNLLFSPNLKITNLKSGKSLYNSHNNRYGIGWAPNKYLRTKYTVGHRSLFAFRESDPTQKISDNHTKLEGLNLNFAPLAFLSMNLDGRREQRLGLYRVFIPSSTDTLADTTELYKEEKKNNINARTTLRIHSKASLEIGGSYEDLSLVIPDSMPTITETYGLNSKLTQEITSWLFVRGGLIYTREKGQNPWISKTNSNICVDTYSPEFGITVSIPNLLKADFSYRFAKSSGDAQTYKDEFTFNFDITQKNFHLPFNLKYESSRDPDYRALSFSTNLNIEM